jgi:hypothetical protein
MQIALFGIVAAVAAVASAQQPSPELSISANGSADLQLPRGWPLIVSGLLLHSQRMGSDASAPPLRIAPLDRSWAEAVSLTLLGDDGMERDFRLRLVGVPDEPALSLGRRAFASLEWQAGAPDTLALAPGKYSLVARLEIQGSLEWNGSIQSRPVAITVVDETDPLDQVQQTRKAMLRARFEMNRQNLEEATAILEELLRINPKSVKVLSFKSVVLEESGRLFEAWQAANQAVAAYVETNPQPAEPPEELYIQRSAILRRLLAQ